MFLNLGLGRMGCLVGALGISAALDLNFASGTFPREVTHSRSGAATQVYSDGLVDYAPENLLLYSSTISNAAWTGSNRTISDNTTADPPGTTGGTTADTIVEDTSVGAFHWIAQAVTKPAVAERYLFTGYCHSSSARDIAVYLQNGANGCNARFRPSTGVNTGPAATFGSGWSSVSSSITSIGGGWHRFALQATSDGTTSITAQIALYNAAFSYTGDGVSGATVYGLRLQRGTHSRAEDDFLLQTTSAAVYGPRITYDPSSLACLGYLNEPQRTNLALYSQQLDNAAWVKRGTCAVVANDTTAPDGTTTADKVTFAGWPTNDIYLVGITATAAAPTSPSFYVKKQTASGTFSVQSTNGAASGEWTVNLATLGSGWERITSTHAAVTVVTPFVGVGGGNDGINIFQSGGSTVVVWIWGVQIEAASTASSYIPTAGASATRAADNAQMTGAAFSSWFNSTQGCFVVEYSLAGTDVPGAVFAANDGTSSNRVDLRAGFSASEVTSGGVGVALSAVGSQGSNKVAISYSASQTAASINGGAADTDVGVGAIPATQLLFAKIDGGIYSEDLLTFKRIRYFNTPKSGAECQSLTT